MNSEKKRTLGSFYTQGNPFLLDPFIKWAETLPTQTKFLEPFAGNGQIPKLLTEAGFDFSCDKSRYPLLFSARLCMHNHEPALSFVSLCEAKRHQSA